MSNQFVKKILVKKEHPIQGSSIEGKLLATAFLPVGKEWKESPNTEPRPPATYNFDDWLTFYSDTIAWRLKELNAIQFNVPPTLKSSDPELHTRMADFTTSFQKLADFLGVTSPKLSWPLKGVRSLRVRHAQDLGQYNSVHHLKVKFTSDSKTGFVVNAVVTLEETSGPPSGLSSGASLMSGSSSG